MVPNLLVGSVNDDPMVVTRRSIAGYAVEWEPRMLGRGVLHTGPPRTRSGHLPEGDLVLHRTARFLPTLAPWRAPFLNLRNHRKLLIVDGQVGFTGGMNIREGHALEWSPRRPVQDLHFRVEGPAVAHFMEAFAEDWAFSTKETLAGQRWFPTIEPRGDVNGRPGRSPQPSWTSDRCRQNCGTGSLGCFPHTSSVQGQEEGRRPRRDRRPPASGCEATRPLDL